MIKLPPTGEEIIADKICRKLKKIDSIETRRVSYIKIREDLEQHGDDQVLIALAKHLDHLGIVN